MPAYHIDRSILINSPIKKIRESLCDFHQWTKWSPWLVVESDIQINFNNKQGIVGAAYDWKGKVTSEGSMILVNISDNKLIMNLTLLKPFRSKATLIFDLQEEEDGTKVIWSMDSKLPFFLFWMVRHIKAFIGMDYERGIRMLKDYLETGSVPTKVIIDGITQTKSQRYIGIANKCNLEDIPEIMPQDFQTVYDFLQKNNLCHGAVPFAVYTVFNIFEKNMEFISAFPIDQEIVVPEPYVTGELEGGNILKVTHTGAYTHIGNAWTAAFSYARYKNLKIKKMPMGIEFYLNNPADTPAEELIAEIVIPLR